MAMKPTMVHLPPSLVERLDRRASIRSVSRSALVREAIERLLEGGTDSQIAAAYVKGYEAMSADAPDEWGDLQAFRQDLHAARKGTDVTGLDVTGADSASAW